MHTCVHKAKKYENVARVHMGVRAMCHTHTRSEGVRARLADALQADRRVRAHFFYFSSDAFTCQEIGFEFNCEYPGNPRRSPIFTGENRQNTQEPIEVHTSLGDIQEVSSIRGDMKLGEENETPLEEHYTSSPLSMSKTSSNREVTAENALHSQQENRRQSFTGWSGEQHQSVSSKGSSAQKNLLPSGWPDAGPSDDAAAEPKRPVDEDPSRDRDTRLGH